MRYLKIRIAIAVWVLMFSACSGKTVVLDYGSYPKLPMSFPVKTLRFVSMSPLTKKKAFWGNYGGPGNKGGEPVDAMDELFRRHDISYLEAMSYGIVLESDRELVERLKGLDESELSEEAKRYRRFAVRFFESATSKVVGKPMSLILKTRRAPRTMGWEPVRTTGDK